MILRAHINISKVQEGTPFLALRQLGYAIPIGVLRTHFRSKFSRRFSGNATLLVETKGDYTRECPAIEVDTSLGELRVVARAGRTEAETRTAVADPQRQRT